ncbi:MAG: VCBS repeat-containing protein [Desulfarculaceae bacterium]
MKAFSELLLASVLAFVFSFAVSPCAGAKDELGTLPGDAIYPSFNTPSWTNSSGWDRAEYYSTIETADLDGDGKEELFARGPEGIEVWGFNTGTGMWDMLAQTPLFSDAAAGYLSSHFMTIFAADIDGDNSAELIGRSSAGLEAYKYDAAKGEFVLLVRDTSFSDAHLWNINHFKTIQAADIDGNGTSDIIARFSNGLRGLIYDPGKKSWQSTSVLGAMSDVAGWLLPQHYTTIQADNFLTGHSQEWVWGYGPKGLEIWKYEVHINDWTNVYRGVPQAEPDWLLDDPSYYSTIQAADLNGDGYMEVFGRTSKGLTIFERDVLPDKQGTTFWLPVATHSEFRDGSGYEQSHRYASIRTEDLDQDGVPELWVADVHGFTAYDLSDLSVLKLADTGPTLVESRGWGVDARHYFETCQFADIDGDQYEEVLIRGGSGLRTFDRASSRGEWSDDLAAPFPAYTKGGEAVAYQAILAELRSEGLLGQSQDLRDVYQDFGKSTWPNMHSAINKMDRPAVSQEVWNAVSTQIKTELNAVTQVQSIYQTTKDHLQNFFSLSTNTITTVQQRVEIEPNNNKIAQFLVGEAVKLAIKAVSASVSAVVPEAAALNIVMPVATSLVSQAFSGLWAKDDITGSKDKLSMKAGLMRDQMNKWFISNLVKTDVQYQDVASRWGKLQQLNAFYNNYNEDWVKILDQSLEPMNEAFKYHTYQALMPVTYSIAYINWNTATKIRWWALGADKWYNPFGLYSEPNKSTYYQSGDKRYVIAKITSVKDYFFVGVVPTNVMQDLLGDTPTDEAKKAVFDLDGAWAWDWWDYSHPFPTHHSH